MHRFEIKMPFYFAFTDYRTWGETKENNMTSAIREDSFTNRVINNPTILNALLGVISSNLQTGTSYTLQLSDQGLAIDCDNGSAFTLTVPTNANVAFPIGQTFEVAQIGAGVVTVAGAGITFLSDGDLLSTSGQGAVCALRKIDTDTWLFYGSRA